MHNRLKKYYPLTAYLRGFTNETFSMRFDVIEEKIGAKLPPSSRTESWWGNTRTSSQGKAWLAAGRRVKSVDVKNGAVVFVRSPPRFLYSPEGESPAPPAVEKPKTSDKLPPKMSFLLATLVDSIVHLDLYKRIGIIEDVLCVYQHLEGRNK